MLFSPVFAEHHPGLFTLPAARRSLQSRKRICSLRFSSTAFLFTAHYQLLTVHSSAKSHGIISFTDPHPLTLLKSYRFKNRGGRVQELLVSSPYFLTSLPPYFRIPKSFICNTYGPPHKYCKQKTYDSGQSLLNPVDATLTENTGVGEGLWLTRQTKRNRSLLEALLPRGLKFIAGEPARQRRLPGRFRSEYEPESGNDRVTRKIHVRAVFVARLMVEVFDEIPGLVFAPLRVMARKLDAFIDRKRRHAHPRQTELIRTVVMSRLRARIRPDGQMKIRGRGLYQRIERRPLRAADFHLFRRAQRRHIIKIQIHHDLPRRHRRMFS